MVRGSVRKIAKLAEIVKSSPSCQPIQLSARQNISLEILPPREFFHGKDSFLNEVHRGPAWRKMVELLAFEWGRSTTTTAKTTFPRIRNLSCHAQISQAPADRADRGIPIVTSDGR
jgi:hypothetical protein